MMLTDKNCIGTLRQVTTRMTDRCDSEHINMDGLRQHWLRLEG